MWATWPAAGPALSLLEFCWHSFYSLPPCIEFFCILNPADPFIPCQGSNLLPECMCFCVSQNDVAQIGGNSVNNPRRNCFLGCGHLLLAIFLLENCYAKTSDTPHIMPRFHDHLSQNQRPSSPRTGPPSFRRQRSRMSLRAAS